MEIQEIIENCRLIKKAVGEGLGTPEMEGDKCMGYGGDMDEPCEICKKCKANNWYGID